MANKKIVHKRSDDGRFAKKGTGSVSTTQRKPAPRKAPTQVARGGKPHTGSRTNAPRSMRKKA